MRPRTNLRGRKSRPAAQPRYRLQTAASGFVSEISADSSNADGFGLSFSAVCSRNRGFSYSSIKTKFSANISTIRHMVKTRVNQASNGQYRTTVPKGIADALDLKDKRLEWSVKSGNKLEVKIHDE